MIIKNKLNEIRESSADTKKKWLIVLSGVSMFFIIIAWVFYMNAYVFQNTQEEEVETIEVEFWPVFKTGLKISAQTVGDKIENVFDRIISKLPLVGKENEITIEAPKTQ